MKKVVKNKAFLTVTAHIAIAFFLFIYIKYLGCPIRHFFGVSCPSCGMGRAYYALFRGEFREAFAFHPLFFLAVPLIFLFLHNDVFNFHISKKALNLTALISIFLFIAVYIIRVFIFHDPVLKPDFDSSVLHRILEHF